MKIYAKQIAPEYQESPLFISRLNMWTGSREKSRQREQWG